MYTSMKEIIPELECENKLIQYRMDYRDPDLRKFEYILNKLVVDNISKKMDHQETEFSYEIEL